MNCPNCGQTVPEINQGQFCPFCGAALAQQESVEQPSPFQTVPEPSRAAPEPASSPSCPWENRGSLGFVTALSQTWTESVLRPTNFFKNMPRTGGIGSPMLYAVLIGSIGALFSLFWEYQLFEKLGTFQNWPEDFPIEMNRNMLIMFVPFIPFALIISMLLMSFIYHLCLLITGSAKNGWETTFRVIAYASGPSLLLFLPFCGGVIAAIWSWTLQVIGWTQAHESTTARVVVAALLPMLLCCGLILWGVMMFASMFKNLPVPEVAVGQVFHALCF